MWIFYNCKGVSAQCFHILFCVETWDVSSFHRLLHESQELRFGK